MTISNKEIVTFTREEAETLIKAKILFMEIFADCKDKATEIYASSVLDAIDIFYDNVTVIGE